MARRSRGTGSLFVRRDRSGAESWYGQWWVGNRRAKRRIGPKRATGSRSGLTRSQAERELQSLIARETNLHSRSAHTVQEVGEELIAHLETLERKRSTLGDYDSYLRIHLVPFFGSRSLTASSKAMSSSSSPRSGVRGARRRAFSTTWVSCVRSSATRRGADSSLAIR